MVSTEGENMRGVTWVKISEVASEHAKLRGERRYVAVSETVATRTPKSKRLTPPSAACWRAAPATKRDREGRMRRLIVQGAGRRVHDLIRDANNAETEALVRAAAGDVNLAEAISGR